MSPLHKIPRGVWVLGFVSMFMDMSSELIHSLLPVFMVSSLGASVMMVGMIEGIAEAAALIIKIFSGVLSDWLGRRKGLAVFGYGLSAMSKPVFALSTTVYWAFFARFMDRIGKGIRGAPRDALVADMVSSNIRGAAYGLRQSLDTIGAFVGPGLAILLMLYYEGDFRQVFWFATLPAILSVILLFVGISEPNSIREQGEVAPPLQFSTLKQFSPAFWWVVVMGGFFTLARFSEAFLILRARAAGLPDTYAPVILIIMNVLYSLSAYPAGKLADRIDRNYLMVAGLLVLLAADLLLAQAQTLTVIFAGVVLWGLHMGITQGLLATMVADASPKKLRGSGFGLFYLVSGIAMLLASLVAGVVWDIFGAAMTFYCGALFAAVSLLLVLLRTFSPKLDVGF